MNHPKGYLWGGELASQIALIVVGSIGLLFMLPYLIAGGFPDFGNVLYWFLGVVLIVNLGAMVRNWRRTNQRVNDLALPANQLLAHWHYDPPSWQEYANHEQRRRLQDGVKWLLFSVAISVIMVFAWRQIFGNNITMPLVVWMTINLILLIGITVIMPYYRTLNTAPEALVAEDGLCIGGVAHFWKNGDVDLLHVQIAQSQPPALEFRLRERKGRSPSNKMVRVPLPNGREEEAKKVVEALIKSMASRK